MQVAIIVLLVIMILFSIWTFIAIHSLCQSLDSILSMIRQLGDNDLHLKKDIGLICDYLAANKDDNK